MDDVMRRALSFSCEGATLVGTLDVAAGSAGLLVVSGGNEVRSGAHRGMAELAASIATKGYPVFRFDRRGVGDSDGENRGFRFTGPDIFTALETFRGECPQLTRIVAFGNCDAATALALHASPVDARVLANPWVIPSSGEMPPAAAVKDRYTRRLRDPEAWKALLTGKIDMRKLAKGLGRLAAAKPAQPDSLADKTVRALEASAIPTTILLATRDATAIAFADVWRNDPSITVERVDSASHSFAEPDAYRALVEVLLRSLD